MNKLEEILAHKREEVEHNKIEYPFDELIELLPKAPPTLDFAAAIRGQENNTISCIAEIKKASPSKGVLTNNFVPEKIAREYFLGGASALSILTDKKFFKGDPSYIALAQQAAKLPVLRKDFIVDEYQIYESRCIGADAILLIVAALTDTQIQSFLSAAKDLSLDCLVECHTKDEVERAVDCGATIIGINNRNLQTFEVDLNTSIHLKKFIPNQCISVSESGIRNAHHVDMLREVGFDAILVGEQLMTQDNKTTALRELLGGKSAR